MISIMMRDSKKINGTVSFFLGILLIGLGLQAGSSIKGNQVVGNADTYSKIGTTLLHVAEALAFSAGIGILIGLAEGSVQWLYSLLRPFMFVIRSLPMIVTVILVMSLLSYRIVPFTATSMILIPVFSEAVYEGCHSLDPDLISLAKRILPDLNETVVASGDRFIEDREDKQTLAALGCQICDMEIAAIARVCFLNRIPCLSIKCISDTFDGTGADFEVNVERSAGKAFSVLHRILREM